MLENCNISKTPKQQTLNVCFHDEYINNTDDFFFVYFDFCFLRIFWNSWYLMKLWKEKRVKEKEL